MPSQECPGLSSDLRAALAEPSNFGEEKILTPTDGAAAGGSVGEMCRISLKSAAAVGGDDVHSAGVLLLSMDTQNELAIIGSPPKVPANQTSVGVLEDPVPASP